MIDKLQKKNKHYKEGENAQLILVIGKSYIRSHLKLQRE